MSYGSRTAITPAVGESWATRKCEQNQSNTTEMKMLGWIQGKQEKITTEMLPIPSVKRHTIICKYNKVLTCCQETVDGVPWAGIRAGCVRVHAACACVLPRSPSYGTPLTVPPSVSPQDPFPRGTNTIIISDRLKCDHTIYVTRSLSCMHKHNNNNTGFSLVHTPKSRSKCCTIKIITHKKHIYGA